jgi:glycosyltransferase involved in cell wall biosynthesis
MKVLFYFHNANDVRDARLSYTSLMEGAGFSGTETALLEMSKFLVDKGHTVQIFGVGSTYIENGISFIGEKDIHLVDLNVDWYSPIFFLDHALQQELLGRLSSNTQMLVWVHFFIDDKEIIKLQEKFKVYAQYVSNYVSESYSYITDSWVIYNGIHSTFICDIPLLSKKGNWIFHPIYERGGGVAREIFESIHSIRPDVANHMNFLSYYTPDIMAHSISNSIENHGSKSKIEVRDLLLGSDYFVYPLVLPNGLVHHDTFGTVILEALACGVIVVVWDVACMSSVYGDNIVKIPVPDHVLENYNPHARFASCPWMLTKEAQQLFIDKILDLESNLEKKESIRQKGVKWARQFTWDVLGADMEQKLLVHLDDGMDSSI